MGEWFCEVCGERITKENFWTQEHNWYTYESVYICDMKPEEVERFVMDKLELQKVFK